MGPFHTRKYKIKTGVLILKTHFGYCSGDRLAESRAFVRKTLKLPSYRSFLCIPHPLKACILGFSS